MDPEIIFTEWIKPSSPTPLHLKIHKLSLLDQLLFHTYFPMIFFYPFNQIQNINVSDQTDINLIVSERLQLLKKSLSDTLTSFYPFAGKFKDNLSVDCNGEGIYFVEARVKSSTLDEFLDNPDIYSIYKFFPFDAREQGESVAGLFVGKIQVTTFACGGLVVCACLSHLFGDGTTLSSFLKSWTARACGNTEEEEEEAIVPDTDASFLFPQNEELPKEATWLEMCAPFYKTGKFVTRRFVFDAKAIAKLKAKATSSRVQNPTRVEVVSALFTKRFIDSPALKTKSVDSHKPINVTHSVNLRPKAKPPISKYSMGNLVRNAYAMFSDDQEDLESIVLKLREAIMKINGDFVKSLQGEKGILNVCEYAREEREVCSNASDRLVFSSWCNFGLYDIDFGWGKPIWVSRFGVCGQIPKFSNTMIFMDTRLRDGIEVWVYLLEEDMKILESDKELLAFATLNPSPLQ